MLSLQASHQILIMSKKEKREDEKKGALVSGPLLIPCISLREYRARSSIKTNQKMR